MIKIDLIGKIPHGIDISSDKINKILSDSASRLNYRTPGVVEVWFVRTDQIKKLNKTHRGIDKPTDVLSFPQEQIPSGQNGIIGSIVVSATMVRQKSEHISDVLKHGLLHLLGYDHDTDEKEWERAAEKIGCEL